MSRYTKQSEDGNHTIAYGYDHTSGYFFQVFDNNIKDDEEDWPILDECSRFTKMSNGKMLEYMEKYKVNEDHIIKVTLDLTF